MIGIFFIYLIIFGELVMLLINELNISLWSLIYYAWAHTSYDVFTNILHINFNKFIILSKLTTKDHACKQIQCNF